MANKVLVLIGKDFRSLWSEKITGLSLLFLLAMSALSASSVTFSGLGIAFFTTSFYIMSVFSLEESFRTERFFASLPVRRRDMVLARYGGIIAITAAYFALAYAINAVFILAGMPKARPIPIGYCATVLALVAFFSSFALPFYFKFGMAAKARIVTMFLIILPMTVGGALIGQGNAGASLPVMKAFTELMANPFPRDPLVVLITFGAAFLLWGTSIPVAVLLYSKRDL
jgi:hypothetical protein